MTITAQPAIYVAPLRPNDPVDSVLHASHVQLAAELAPHFATSPPSCPCEDCQAFVALVEAREERIERLRPEASICARCSTSVARRDAIAATRDFGMSLCPRDFAWATNERLAGRRPIIKGARTNATSRT